MIAKLFAHLRAVRRTVNSPAAQVAIAGTLLTLGARVLESLLTDLVEQHALAQADRNVLRGQVAQLWDRLGTLYADQDGVMRLRGTGPAGPAEVAYPTGVDLDPLGAGDVDQAEDRGVPNGVHVEPLGRAAAAPPAG